MALDPGDTLILRAEPDNPYDPEAIRVEDTKGNHLGYIPRTDTYQWHPHLQDGTLEVEFETGERVYAPNLDPQEQDPE